MIRLQERLLADSYAFAAMEGRYPRASESHVLDRLKIPRLG